MSCGLVFGVMEGASRRRENISAFLVVSVPVQLELWNDPEQRLQRPRSFLRSFRTLFQCYTPVLD